jgi:anthranilate synthase component 1
MEMPRSFSMTPASTRKAESVGPPAGWLMMKVIALAKIDDRTDLKKAYALACEDIDRTVERLNTRISNISSEGYCVVSGLQSNFTKDEFENAVRKAKEYIVAGDVIQVVLSQRFSGNIIGEDFSLYRRLRSVNPSPYMFFLDFGDYQLVGSSPEIHAKLAGRRELLSRRFRRMYIDGASGA